MKVLLLLCIVGLTSAASQYNGRNPKSQAVDDVKEKHENALQEEGSGEYEESEDEVPPGIWSERQKKIFMDVARALDKVKDDLTQEEQDMVDDRLEGDDCNGREEIEPDEEEDDEHAVREKRQTCKTCEHSCKKGNCRITNCCYPQGCHTKCTWWGKRAKCECY